MAKAELGTKRICPETGRKFYDLNKTPVISPYTGKVVPIVVAPVRSRPEPAAAARPAPVAEPEVVAPETADAEFVSLDDAEAEQQGKKKSKPTRPSTMPPSLRNRTKAIPMCPTSSARPSKRKKSSSRKAGNPV